MRSSIMVMILLLISSQCRLKSCEQKEICVHMRIFRLQQSTFQLREMSRLNFQLSHLSSSVGNLLFLTQDRLLFCPKQDRLTTCITPTEICWPTSEMWSKCVSKMCCFWASLHWKCLLTSGISSWMACRHRNTRAMGTERVLYAVRILMWIHVAHTKMSSSDSLEPDSLYCTSSKH